MREGDTRDSTTLDERSVFPILEQSPVSKVSYRCAFHQAETVRLVSRVPRCPIIMMGDSIMPSHHAMHGKSKLMRAPRPEAAATPSCISDPPHACAWTRCVNSLSGSLSATRMPTNRP